MEVLVICINISKHLKKEREREKRGGVHQTNTNYHLLEVLVPTKHQTNTCVWLQSVSFGVSLLLTMYFGTPSMFITLLFGFDYGTNTPVGTLII
jgi:hypothetical protein